MTYRTLTTAPTPIDDTGVVTTTAYPAKPSTVLTAALVAALTALSITLAAVLMLQPRIVHAESITAIETTVGYALIYPTPDGTHMHWYHTGETIIGGTVVSPR